jgi:hypothetical protein
MSAITEQARELIYNISTLKDRKEKLEQELKDTNNKLQEEYDRAVTILDPEEKIALADIGRVCLTYKPRFNTLNKEELIKRFKNDPELAVFVEETVHPSRLSAFLKNKMAEEGKLPFDDIIEVYNQPYVSITKL